MPSTSGLQRLSKGPNLGQIPGFVDRLWTSHLLRSPYLNCVKKKILLCALVVTEKVAKVPWKQVGYIIQAQILYGHHGCESFQMALLALEPWPNAPFTVSAQPEALLLHTTRVEPSQVL